MDERAEILARVRAARVPAATASRPRASSPEPSWIDLSQPFSAELSALAATVSRVGSESDLPEHLGELLRERGATRVVSWPSRLLERVRAAIPSTAGGIDWTVAPGGGEQDRTRWRSACLEADVGITEVDYAIADTGTLVVRATPEQPRLASLLPPTHIAIVRLEQILPDLGALLRELGTDPARLTPCLTLITGPSRTADIEKKIVLGVHGPAHLHVTLLG